MSPEEISELKNQLEDLFNNGSKKVFLLFDPVTVLSVISAVYGLYSSIKQSQILNQHVLLSKKITEEMAALTKHIHVSFDTETINKALSISSSVISDLVNFENIVNLEDRRNKLLNARSKLSTHYENLKLRPHNSKQLIVQLQGCLGCAVTLAWIDGQELLYFPRDSGLKHITQLRDVIAHIKSLSPDITSLIKSNISDRFTNINFRFFTSEWIGNPSDYALFSTYFLDGEIKTFHEYRIISGLNDPSKVEKAYSEFRKEFDSAIRDQEKIIFQDAKKVIGDFEISLKTFEMLLVDASFQFILNRDDQEIPAMAPNLEHNMKVYSELGHNKFALRLASSNEGKALIEKSFSEILKHPVTDPSNEEEYQRHIKNWIVVLAKDGYHQLRFGLARSPEGKAKVTHVFKSKYSRDPLPRELDKYTSKLALIGYDKLVEYVNSPSSEDFDFFRASPSTNGSIVDEIQMITDKHRARL